VELGKKGGKLAIGKEYNFYILKLSPTDKKVSLSMKGVPQEEPAQPAAADKPAAEVAAPSASPETAPAPSTE
jgi:ribosomal protein S1